MSRVQTSGGMGSGSSSSSATSIANILIAGQTFLANTSYIVRWGIDSLGENPTQVYAADYDASVNDKFWAIGIGLSLTAVSPGGPINVYSLGIYTLGSADAPFLVTDNGHPVWLTSAGAFSATAPSGDNFADEKIGMVMAVNQIWINDQLTGVGGSGGGGGGGGSGVTSLNGLEGAVIIAAGTPNVTISEVGNTIEVSVTGSGSGNVTGLLPTTIDSIARWADTTGTTIKNSPSTFVQDSGAIEAQAFITMRNITGNVTVNADETWIAPSLEISLTGSIVIASDGDIIIV